MSQCMIFCRTNVDCDNLELFLNTVDGGDGQAFRGKVNVDETKLINLL